MTRRTKRIGLDLFGLAILIGGIIYNIFSINEGWFYLLLGMATALDITNLWTDLHDKD